jgi:pyruvate carboxylase
MARALGEYRVAGVRTTIPVLARIVAHPDFRAGRLSTGFVDRLGPALTASADGAARPIAVIAAARAPDERGRRAAPPAPRAATPGAWRLRAWPGWRGAS